MINYTSKSLIYILLTFTGSFNLFSQNEYNNWLFRENTKISLNTGTPVISLIQPNMNMSAPSAISDCFGNLLFFSNGHSVWDKNQNPMPAGNATLLGGEADSLSLGIFDYQPVLIIPWPGEPDKYFILTTSQIYGFRYSVVDMSLNNGLGDVTTLNVLIESDVTGNITATASTDGGYLIIIQKKNLPIFKVYKVGPSGINVNPVVNQFTNSLSFHNYHNFLKISSDGLLVGGTSGYEFNLFSLDNSTGTMSLIFNYAQSSYGFWGIEFSPDNSKLYILGSEYGYYRDLYQFDITVLDSASIYQSKNIIYNSPNHYSDFVLASNGKIYLYNWWAMYLSVINNPNSYGLACNYVDNYLHISSQSATTIGMQNQVNSALNQKITVKNSCYSDTTTFIYTGSHCIDSVLWNLMIHLHQMILQQDGKLYINILLPEYIR